MPLKLLAAMGITLLLLFGFLFGLLAAVGYYFELPGYLIVILAIFLVFVEWLISPTLIRWTTNMRPLERGELPWLRDDVEELCKKIKVPIPKIFMAYSGKPNAFVFGRTPSSAELVVTKGLLNSLTKDEVRAVIAHEVGHIKHKDMVVMTIVGAIPVIAYFIFRFLIFVPSKDEKRSGGTFLVGVAAFFIYIITNLLVLALSRLREYYSDRFSGENTKPRDLASGLAKITYGLGMAKEKDNESVRSFFIVDPLSAVGEISKFSSEYSDLELNNNELKRAMEWERKNPFARIGEIFSTHPLTYKRILALKKLEKEL
jgi:heat shock protein HtpX